jgi:hypothetical protein
MVATFVFPGLRDARIGVCASILVLLGATVIEAVAAPSYDFAYRVTGDRRVAPQQVFDDGASTYLQFYPGQVLPALIAVGSDGAQRLLTHAQLGPYVTVPGTHTALVAQLGTVRAVIDYGGRGARVAGEDAMNAVAVAQSAPQPAAPVSPAATQGVPFAPPWISASGTAPATPAAAPAPVAAVRPSASGAHAAPAVGGVTSSAPPNTPSFQAGPAAPGIPPLQGGLASTAPNPSQAGPASAAVNASFNSNMPSRDVAPVTANADGTTVADAWPTVATPPAKPFEATLADQNLRRALSKWATQAGWTFRPEHWTPDIDIAVSAPAVFGPDFKTAVRGLLAGTELSAKPLQPCFYSNLVLRVVPQTERCDRRVAQ